MPFDESPVGGMFLIIPAIRSPNYQAGTLGWTINADGTAQFFNVTIVGSDLKVLGANGSVVELTTVGAVAELLVLPGGGNVIAGKLLSGVASGSGAPQMLLISPQQTLTTPNSVASILLQGANATFPGSFININSDQIQIVGLAGTSGVGSAGLNLGANQGLPATANLFAVNSSIGMDGGGASLANNITLATGTLSLLGLTIDDGTNRRYLLTQSDNFDCSGTQAVGGALVAIPGMSHSYPNVSAGARWEAFVTIDAQLNATAGNVMHTQLVVAGVVQANTLDQGPRVSTSDSATRSWSGTFAGPAGALSFAVNSNITGGGGLGNNVLISASTLHVKIYE